MSFSSDIAQFSKDTEKKATLVFKKIAFDMLERIQRRTPVDTGRLRGNWQLTPRIPRIGDKAAILNNMPYAQRIEDGYSAQAPSGMVKVTVSEFDSIVKKATQAVK